MNDTISIPNVDKTTFTNAPFLKRIEKPWGYELLFTPSDLPYTGKLLHIDEGKQISLQVHDKKQETQILMSGRCMRIADDKKGELGEIEMQPLTGYTNLVGQRHRVRAITDCDIYEASTPELGVTYRLDDDYKRPNETEEMRNEERKSL